MVARIVMEEGQRFGRWTVLSEATGYTSPAGYRLRCVMARCDCGVERAVLWASLRQGRSLSCGCHKREVSTALATKHGMHHLPLYECWCNMKQRSSGHYPRPAYAGVGRDRRWDSFDNFRADMGATYFPGAVLARYGDVGDYGPTNCRWITKSENSSERRARP